MNAAIHTFDGEMGVMYNPDKISQDYQERENSVFATLKDDLRAALQRDPAAVSPLQVILFYPGFHAIVLHRLAHRLHEKGLFWLPHFISWFSRFLTGVEIHPGARIGKGFFIDHGMGVVIGETTRIGTNVTLYQGAVLGGIGRNRGKRHPDIADRVMIGAGAKVLGPVEVGEGSKVGAGAVLLQSIPPGSTAVGVPAEVVRRATASGGEDYKNG